MLETWYHVWGRGKWGHSQEVKQVHHQYEDEVMNLQKWTDEVGVLDPERWRWYHQHVRRKRAWFVSGLWYHRVSERFPSPKRLPTLMQPRLYGERHISNVKSAASTFITATLANPLQKPGNPWDINSDLKRLSFKPSFSLSCCWSFFTSAFFLPSLMSFPVLRPARSGDVSQKLRWEAWALSFLPLLFCTSEKLGTDTFATTPSRSSYPSRLPRLANILPYLKW